MKITEFREKKITVMGIGLHGGALSVIRFFSNAGAKVIATDIKNKDQLAKSLEKLKGIPNVQVVLGQHRMEDFTRVDMVVKNPAVPWSERHIQAALAKGIPVEVDASIFMKLIKVPVIGVTGSKGKTTTATLIKHILETAGKKVFGVGISQVPVLDKIDEINGTENALVVFELSSWRLSGLGRTQISPQIAVITNVYPDHLNYYRSMEKYVADKKFIFSNQDKKGYLILNFDNLLTREMAAEAKGKAIFFSADENRFHRDAVFIRNGKIVLLKHDSLTELAFLSDVKLKGAHNLMNVLAACAAVSVLDIKPEKISQALRTFKGVEHRLEFVCQINSVKYFNDTAATMPEATIAAIKSFSGPIILIAGGADKNLDFSGFVKAISDRIKKLILIEGEATEKIKNELIKINTQDIIEGEFNDLEMAVRRAKDIGEPGDVVLFSPGAASFNLFKNEFDRGEKYKEILKTLSKN